MLTKQKITEIKASLNSDTSGFILTFQALGDAGRFNIFRLLIDNHDMCVTDIANILSITVSAASQQLRIMERLGLVIKMRMGQMVCYEINQENVIAKKLIKLIN